MSDDNKKFEGAALFAIIFTIVYGLLTFLSKILSNKKPENKSVAKATGNIQKGDSVTFHDKEYVVENVLENYEKGLPLYTICRTEPADGGKLKLTCHKIIPDKKEDELKKVK